MIRRSIRRLLLARAVSRAHRLDVSSLVGTTLVLAPHPDDETLGSGGLIALLRDRGEVVEVVFMTDGAGSHPTSPDLSGVRRREATEAAAVLGVPDWCLHFLEYPDGSLSLHESAACDRLVAIIARLTPVRIVLPQHIEPNDDHASTYRIAERAVSIMGRPVMVFAYLVWFWDQWPWTNPFAPPRRRHGRRRMVTTARRGWLGFGVGRRLTHAVDISTVLDRKAVALRAHASQMARPAHKPDWLTLEDVADGEWLDLLMQPHELYAVTTMGAP